MMTKIWTFLCSSNWLMCVASGLIVGAAVLPHGDFAYDPSLVENKNGSKEIHASCIKVGGYISSLKPNVIFLMTPHGQSLSNDFAFYANSKGAGYATIGQDLHNSSHLPYKVSIEAPFAQNLSKNLISKLIKAKLNVSALLSFADSEPQQLRWGEVVPLKFLPLHTIEGAQVIVLSHPLRRFNCAQEMVPEMLELGKHLFRYLDSQAERIVILASSDLAHTHQANGPYGYSRKAEPFDRACGLWATNPKLHKNQLLEAAAEIEIEPLSCGFPSLVVLHGILQQDFSRWKPKLYANAHPTYYGMMVASY